MALNNLQKLADTAKISDTTAMKLMSEAVVTVGHNQSIKTTIMTLINKKISGAPVVDGTLKIIGVVTEHDLLLQAATKDILSPITFTSPAITVQSDATLKDVLVLFYKKKIKRLPVVDRNNMVLGIITRRDILTILMDKS